MVVGGLDGVLREVVLGDCHTVESYITRNWS